MPESPNPLDPWGILGGLGGILSGAAGAIPNPVAPVNKLFTILTDRGILIRTATVMGGLLLMVIGVFLLFREPVTAVATKVAKAVV